MSDAHLNLKNISDYWLEGKNWYWDRAEKFNITHDELRALWIVDWNAYLNEKTCLQLQKIENELNQEWLHIVVKDAYRSKELYDLVIQKRILLLWEEDTKKIMNTKNTYPHATGNTVDVTIVDKQTNTPLKLFAWDIQDRADLLASWTTMFYENATDEEWQEIHKNRMLLKNIMEKYGFAGIDIEYRHFNLAD